MSEGDMGTNKTPNDPVKEQIAQDKFGKSYDECTGEQQALAMCVPAVEQMRMDCDGMGSSKTQSRQMLMHFAVAPAAHERIQVGGTKGGIVTKVRCSSRQLPLRLVTLCMRSVALSAAIG